MKVLKKATLKGMHNFYNCPHGKTGGSELLITHTLHPLFSSERSCKDKNGTKYIGRRGASVRS